MKRMYVCDVGDIMSHGETLGYNWNVQCDMFENLMLQECHSTEVYRSDCQSDCYGWGSDMCLIIGSFMDQNKVKEMMVTR